MLTHRHLPLALSDTKNGNHVWYYPCNFTPAQYWYKDTATNYIRSSINQNKCLVGSSGSSSKGTSLIINDCFNDDDRFRWDIYTDGSVRPRNNKSVCIEADINAGYGQGLYLTLDSCNDEFKTFRWQEQDSRRTRKLLPGPDDGQEEPKASPKNLFSHKRKKGLDGCADSPEGWYDIFGRNCHWYAEEETNCDVYGSQYENFGKTAKSAVSRNP